MSFWNNVKLELNYLGLTQKDLANKADLNYRTLQNWIARNIQPDISSAVKIAKALNVSAEYLLDGNSYAGLNDDELAMLIHYRKLSDATKDAIKQLLASLSV